ncbi:MAG TPA: Clp protease N-terminal domain-containing protein [Candidatus Acidoferrum sp.]|nr:Clp protease N-terminal domain-containing protein [Candidatus Acidoferrum sp.]
MWATIVSIHRLVQAVLKDGMGKHEQNIWNRRANAKYPSKFVYQSFYKKAAKSFSGEAHSEIEAIMRNQKNQLDIIIEASFTQEARKVLSVARDEVMRLQHNYIGTEHLLLGLVHEGESVAAKVLSNLGVELNKVRSAVEFILGRGDRIVLGEIDLTPRAKKVIELSVNEAERLNHDYIGTEHLLLGLVREGEGIGAGVLESLGVTLEKVRAQTVMVLSRGNIED